MFLRWQQIYITNTSICFQNSGVSLRFGAGGHLDLAPGQSLCKALKILNIYSCRDAKSSRAKLSLQPVNIPGTWPLMKPLRTTEACVLAPQMFINNHFGMANKKLLPYIIVIINLLTLLLFTSLTQASNLLLSLATSSWTQDGAVNSVASVLPDQHVTSMQWSIHTP